jgi:hypothetical protein
MSFLIEKVDQGKFGYLNNGHWTITDYSDDNKCHLLFDYSYSYFLTDTRNIETLDSLIA